MLEALRRIRPRSRWLLVVAGAAVALGAVGLWISWALFADPALDEPTAADPVDAIVMLAGGGRRLDRAVGLANEGVADTLVVASAWTPPVWAARHCNSGQSPFERDVRLLCFQPDPTTTRGEIRFAADLARDEGWDRLVVVASTDQVTRARMLFDRCWDGDVQFVGVDHSQPLPVRMVYEWAALTKALVNRGC